MAADNLYFCGICIRMLTPAMVCPSCGAHWRTDPLTEPEARAFLQGWMAAGDDDDCRDGEAWASVDYFRTLEPRRAALHRTVHDDSQSDPEN